MDITPSASAPGARVVTVLRSGRTPLLLAPMATLSHAGLRVLTEEFGGCDLYFSEMISAEAMIGGTSYERYYTIPDPDPDRLIYQLVGYSEDAIVEAASRLAGIPAVGVDINMGCSAPHIVRRGGGVAWMSDPERAARLVGKVRAAVGAKSLSVKVRLGATDDPDALVHFCRGLEQGGIDFLTLHPKSRKEGSSRPARWSYVRLLREELTVPVVGNGGITGHDTLEARRALAGDGPVMIGRAAARAPWIFAYLKARMNGVDDPWRVDLARVSRRFFELLERYQPVDFLPTRAAHFAAYLTGNLAFGHSLGARLGQSRSYPHIKSELLAYFDAHPDAALHVERG